MPSRLEPFINNGIYHIFNKTIDSRILFKDIFYCSQFLNIVQYYRSNETKFSYSQLLRLDPLIVRSYLKKINAIKTFRVVILAYCLMPTHFHFLIKQTKDKGISRYMADIINSFTRYFNIRIERKGPVFLSDFKSVQINNEAQFMHVSRYIHLNPYNGGIVKNYEELQNYPWSSLKDYIHGINGKIISPKDLMLLFNNNRKRYKRFILSNAQHQRTLEVIKYSEKW